MSLANTSLLPMASVSGAPTTTWVKVYPTAWTMFYSHEGAPTNALEEDVSPPPPVRRSVYLAPLS